MIRRLVDLVAGEAAPPVSTEIQKTCAELNLGIPWEQALDNLSRRVPIEEVHLFASAVLLHSKTGGKLNEVMRRLSETMREQVALRGEVRALGDIVQDQIPLMRRCGFNSFVVTHGPTRQALEAGQFPEAAPFYQPAGRVPAASRPLQRQPAHEAESA